MHKRQLRAEALRQFNQGLIDFATLYHRCCEIEMISASR